MLEFSTSQPLTLGVELELMIVNRRDYNLTRGSDDLLHLLGRHPHGYDIKPEITQGMIEIGTAVHSDVNAMLEELLAIRALLVRTAEKLNLGLAGGGSHPFQHWSDQRIYPKERYQLVSELYGYLAKQFTVYGQHIHIGCPDGDSAIYLTHMLTRYVPHFIALAAASPFYQGVDTQFQSSRLTAVSAFPLSGHMPFVRDWAEFTAYFETMRGFGIVESMKDFYWDIRPKPEYGTIEIRVCDTPLTVRRAALLAAYAQALAAWLLAERPAEPVRAIYQVNAYNRFEACRFGCGGAIVDPFERRKRTVGEDILSTIAETMPRAAALGGGVALTELAAGVRGNYSAADWLRERQTATGSLPDVVREACALWARA